jgi:hypothetical protein
VPNEAPTAPTSNAPVLTSAPTVTLHARLVVGSPDAAVQASVTGPSLAALRTQLKATRAPGGPTPNNQSTGVGSLAISPGSSSGVGRVAVSAYLNGLQLAGSLTFDWKIQTAPAGSTATVQGANTPAASIAPDRPGTYDVQVTVGDRPAPGSSTSEQPVVITAQPDDPPIGAPIETVASDDGKISVGGQVLKDTGAAKGMSYAVLERATREVQVSGHVGADSGGISELQGIVKKYTGPKAYLMVINSPSKRDSSADVGPLLTSLGLAPPADQERSFLKGGSAFSVLGIPGAPAGAAWSSIGVLPQRRLINMTGYLELNQGTNQYDFVSPERPTFDTKAAGSTDTQNVIQVGGKTYTAALAKAGTSGFHVLAVDPRTLEAPTLPQNNKAYPTNGDNADATEQQNLGSQIAYLSGSVYPHPLIIVQSIGKPHATTPSWSNITSSVQSLGGNPAVSNAQTEASAGYALLGRAQASSDRASVTAPPAESTSVYNQAGKVAGVLSRTRTFAVAPTVADPSATPNTDLVAIAYQAPQPFPAFAGGQIAADDYVGRKLALCKPDDPGTCDVRHAYWANYRADWHQKATDLQGMQYPSGETRFTAADFTAVKNQLQPEISARNNVQTYLDYLQHPFEKVGTRALVDLKELGDAVTKDVTPPPARVGVNGFGILATFVNFAKVGADLWPASSLVKAALDGISGEISLAASFSVRDGTPTLASKIEAKTSELASAVLDRFDASQLAINGLGLLIVSDYGKLTAAAGKVDTDWKLPPSDAGVLASLRNATKAWYYQQILPVAYAMATVNGVNNARDYTCFSSLAGPKRTQPGPSPNTSRPLGNEPDSGQDRQIVGFNGDGSPIAPVIALYTDRGTNEYGVPSAGVTDPLFRSLNDPKAPGLGLYKSQVYNRGTFAFNKTLNNDQRCPFG